MACYRLDDDLWFPAVEEADACGLLAVGGDLSTERLLMAYSLGIFPWFNPGDPILWWSPDPRCVLRPENLHVSRSLRRFMRQSSWRISFNENFAAVIYWCRSLRVGLDGSGTWITREMRSAYLRLHELGFAHSVECWDGDQLVGGLYGVAIGRCFFGESMFSRKTNASKIVLVHLMDHLKKKGYLLLDCQQTTGHLLSMGAEEISRADFKITLSEAALPPYGPLVSHF